MNTDPSHSVLAEKLPELPPAGLVLPAVGESIPISPSGFEHQTGELTPEVSDRPSTTPLPQLGSSTTTTGAITTPIQPSSIANHATPLTAIPPLTSTDGDDVLTKEVVGRAKAIVTETKDDPRREKAELSRLKADFIERRFGKKISSAGT